MRAIRAGHLGSDGSALTTAAVLGHQRSWPCERTVAVGHACGGTWRQVASPEFSCRLQAAQLQLGVQVSLPLAFPFPRSEQVSSRLAALAAAEQRHHEHHTGTRVPGYAHFNTRVTCIDTLARLSIYGSNVDTVSINRRYMA